MGGHETAIMVVDDGTSTNENRLDVVKDIALALESNYADMLVMADDNALDFSMMSFMDFFKVKQVSYVMTYEGNRLEKQRKIIHHHL